MTTIDQAREAVYARWVAQWASTTPFVFDNEASQTLDNGTTAWARVMVREVGGGQETLGAVTNRKYRRLALLFVQLFTPVDAGMRQSGVLAQQVRTIFEGTSFSGLDFNNVQVREASPDGRWHHTLCEGAFAYEEIK